MADAATSDLLTRVAVLEEKEKALERKNERLEAKVSELNAVLQRGRGAVYVLGVLGTIVGLALGWADKVRGLFS